MFDSLVQSFTRCLIQDDLLTNGNFLIFSLSFSFKNVVIFGLCQTEKHYSSIQRKLVFHY
jgi:hypothetical protein